MSCSSPPASQRPPTTTVVRHDLLPGNRTDDREWDRMSSAVGAAQSCGLPSSAPATNLTILGHPGVGELTRATLLPPYLLSKHPFSKWYIFPAPAAFSYVYFMYTYTTVLPGGDEGVVSPHTTLGPRFAALTLPMTFLHTVTSRVLACKAVLAWGVSEAYPQLSWCAPLRPLASLR